MRSTSAAILTGFLLGGCGQAQAATIDPKNDVHCSVLAFYFHGLAKHVGAPDKQEKATRGLHDWYAAKMRTATKSRFTDAVVMEREIGPLLEAIKADPLSMRDEMIACGERAQADPAFDGFAATYMR